MITRRLYEELREPWMEARSVYKEAVHQVLRAEAAVETARESDEPDGLRYAQDVVSAMEELKYARGELERVKVMLAKQYEKAFDGYPFKGE